MKMIIRPAISSLYFFVLTFLFIMLYVLLINCKKKDTTPVSTGKVDLKLVADGFVSPIGVVSVPDNTGRLFVIDQIGKIWIIDQSGNKLSTPLIDVSSAL